MGNFEEIGKEIELELAQSPYDRIRRKCLQQLSEKTGRNVIVYYSGWLQKPGLPAAFVGVSDLDVQGFMGACNGLDRSKHLDLILHTPGGQLSATQAIVAYLRKMFADIRVVVPQLAMSAGTMIACSARSVLMGKQSSLGPIDPQLNGWPAHGVLSEFERTYQEILADQSPNLAKRALWQPILAQYKPTFIGECQNAIDLAEEMVKQWLKSGMFANDKDSEMKSNNVVQSLASHADTKQHDRHLSADECTSFGMVIEMLEEDQDLQDAVLSVHHACMHTLAATPTLKIIENQSGVSFNVQGVAAKS